MDLAQLEGLVGEASLIVGAGDLASALGSGDVDVLGTPRLVALCEEATVSATAGLIPEDRTSVGARVEIEHLRPNRLGDYVTATAVVTSVSGPMLTFEVKAESSGREIGRGIVMRAVVDRARFVERAEG